MGYGDSLAERLRPDLEPDKAGGGRANRGVFSGNLSSERIMDFVFQKQANDSPSYYEW